MSAKIMVAGARGMVGAAMVRALNDRATLKPTRAELDLSNTAHVDAYFAEHRPDQLYIAAAKVGGIHANNSFPADFLADNLMIQLNLIGAAHRHGCARLMFLGSSCIYPKLAAQPMAEDALLTGPLEPTNEPYAIAKIAGIKLCESYRRQYGSDFRSAMPTNLYGPGDNFDLQASHVIPALMRKIHEAKMAQNATVEVWGSGSPRREFLHVDDLARGVKHLMELPTERYWGAVDVRQSHINIGSGVDLTIRELATLICRVVGYSGALQFDASKPDGAPRKLLNVDLIGRLGWRAEISLEAGLKSTYQHFLER